MAPISPDIISSLAISLSRAHQSWTLAASTIPEQMQDVPPPADILSDIWAWVVGLFGFIGTVLPSALTGGENAGDQIAQFWAKLSEYLVQPHIRNLLIIWFIVFWVVLFIPLILGFGPGGVLAGSAAAWFQSAIYGAFTPAGGIFAVLTSVGMMGIAYPPAVLLAVVVASIVTGIVWGTQG